MRKILGFGAGVISLLPMQAHTSGPEMPKLMTRIVVRVSGPRIKSGSFAALPRTIYRAGDRYARIEDPPDAQQRLEKLTIVAEPDAYSLNVIEKKGTHAVDSGGPSDIHLPVVLPFDPKHKLSLLDRLEFGDEFGFFQNAGAIKQPGPLVNGKPTDRYVLRTPEGPATLVVKAGTERPIFFSWHTQDGTYRYEYIQYEEEPFNASLFAKPAGYEIKEIRPEPGDSRQ